MQDLHTRNPTADAPTLAAVLDGISRPVIVRDKNLNYVHANAAACALLGRSLDELLTLSAFDITPREEVEAFHRIDREVLLSGKPHQNEEDLTLWDGSRRRMLAYKWCMTLPGSDERLLITEITDVTELRRAQQELKANEEHFRSFIELHPHIPWTADAQGRIDQAAPGWKRLAGKEASRNRVAGWLDAIHPDDREIATRHVQENLATGNPLDMELRLRTCDDTWRWFRVRGAPRRDENGAILRWYGLTEDVQDRYEMMEALRESEVLFSTMANDAPAMIWTCGPDGEASFFSRLWLETTGQTQEEARGQGWLDAIHPDDRARVQREFLSALPARAPIHAEYRLCKHDGTYAWVIDIAQPRFNESGHFLGYVGSALDITKRHEAEQAERQTQALIASLFESSPDALRLLNMDNRLILSNRTARKIFGPEASEPGSSLVNFIAPEEWPAVSAGIDQVRAGRTTRISLTLDQGRKPMELILAPVLGIDGTPDRFLSIWRDVSGIRAAQAKAEEAADRLALVLESMIEGVLVVDAEWRMTYLNLNARTLLRMGLPPTGMKLSELFPGETNHIFRRTFEEVMSSRVPQSFEARLDALSIWLAVRVSPTGDGLSIFFRDVTERRRVEQANLLAQRQIVHMSRHDTLTGLPNRLHFRERLDRALLAQNLSPAVLVLDLDGFKAVNDAYGHPAGDILLRQVADRLKGCVRAGDTVARFGGDEFCLVQPQPGTTADTVHLAQRLIDKLSDPYDLGGVEVAIGVSIGISFARDTGNSADDLIKAADIALYRAKASGRGTWCCFTPGMERELKARQEMKITLRHAFARGELEVHYQPLVNLRAGTISSFEALVRWRHPVQGLITPADFIPVAEESGLIKTIGEWVLRTACTEAVSWPEPIGVAVNLSVLQFRSGNLAEIVRDVLAETGLAPLRLQLEITETVLLDDNGSNLRTLQQLRALGVRITMDDFGTGYSSLRYLRQFPFDKIKVDRGFIQELPEGKESMAVIRAVAGIGRSLSIVTTAEGVETERQLAAVTAEGFDEAQGFFFTHPIPANQVRRTLEVLDVR